MTVKQSKEWLDQAFIRHQAHFWISTLRLLFQSSPSKVAIIKALQMVFARWFDIVLFLRIFSGLGPKSPTSSTRSPNAKSPPLKLPSFQCWRREVWMSHQLCLHCRLNCEFRPLLIPLKSGQSSTSQHLKQRRNLDVGMTYSPPAIPLHPTSALVLQRSNMPNIGLMTAISKWSTPPVPVTDDLQEFTPIPPFLLLQYPQDDLPLMSVIPVPMIVILARPYCYVRLKWAMSSNHLFPLFPFLQKLQNNLQLLIQRIMFRLLRLFLLDLNFSSFRGTINHVTLAWQV